MMVNNFEMENIKRINNIKEAHDKINGPWFASAAKSLVEGQKTHLDRYLLKIALFFVILLVKMKFSGSSTSSNSHEQSGVSTNRLRSSKSDILKNTFSIKV